MRIVLWLLGAIAVLAGVALLRRRHARLNAPTLVQDLDAWNRSQPLPKPRQVYTGTQPVDRKALARALKGRKATKQKPRRDFKIVPDDIRRIG